MHYRYPSKNICVTCAENDPALYVIPSKKQQSKRIQKYIETIKQTTLIRTGDLIVLVGEDAGTVYACHEAHDEDFNFPMKDACDDHDAICSSCGKRCCTHRTPDRMLTCWACDYQKTDCNKTLTTLRAWVQQYAPEQQDLIKQIAGIDVMSELSTYDVVCFVHTMRKKYMQHLYERDGTPKHHWDLISYSHASAMEYLRDVVPKTTLKPKKPTRKRKPDGQESML